MAIKTILDEIKNESSTNQKMVILAKYKDNELLKRVMYMAHSGRVKFYIKQIPSYEPATSLYANLISLETALDMLGKLSSREYTGNEATNYLYKILSSLEANDAYVVERVIGKDLKINMGGNINKVIPNLIEVAAYKGCKPYSVDLVKKLFENNKSCFAQVKMDGCYNNAIIRDGDVENESRQGEPVVLTNALFIKELSLFPDCVFNGELTLKDCDNRLLANGIIRSLIDIAGKINVRTPEETSKKIAFFEKEKGCVYQEMLDRVMLTVWDMLYPEEYYNAKSNRPYNERWQTLNEVLSKQNSKMIIAVETEELFCFEDALKYFQKCLNRGLEGCIIKAKNAKWENGKKNDQIKMKLELDVDLEIIGFNYGTKGTKNENIISSLICKSHDGLLFSEPGGIDEKTMKYITNNQDELLNKIVHVKSCGICQDKLGNYSLLHPRIGEQKFRDDKTIADTLEEIKDNENMCKGLK